MPPLRQRDNQRLQKKLAQDAVCGRAQRLADANLARALAHRHQHHVHHAEAAKKQGDDTHRAEKILHAIGHGAGRLGLPESCPR